MVNLVVSNMRAQRLAFYASMLHNKVIKYYTLYQTDTDCMEEVIP